MKKESILLVTVALIVGVLAGAIVTNLNKDSAPGKQSELDRPAAPTNAAVQNIKTLKAITSREPDNRNAWFQLAHTYFDLNQSMEAIEAYDKALALDGNDPHALTDQGIMFRKVGWFEKAIANFTKANEIKPDHSPSLLNLGFVYREDLNDIEKAKAAWTRYLEVDSQGEHADQVKSMIDNM
jgi:tetratricopeptide (TPR) repeat protein